MIPFRSGLTAAVLLLLAGPLRAAEPQPKLLGDIYIHDPSVIETDGEYVALGTGEAGRQHGAIRVKTSRDGIEWTNRGAIGGGAPAWAVDKLGFLPSSVWAPSISRHGKVVSIYYCVSSFGTNASAIGLMTNETFDPERPGDGWKDQGLVLSSGAGDDFNALDPFRIDLSNGRAFLSYGSFWSGIKLRELSPQTGKLLPDAPTFALAARAGGGAVEASAILEHASKFYLFVSFDQCCKGVASTYNMRVGRAARVEGPYLDKDGKDMREGGGTLLQAASGRFVGPGGQEPVQTTKGEMLAYHYYDGAGGGAAKLQFSPLGWSADGWPELGALPP